MGEVLKVKVIVPLLLLKTNESDGIPFTVKSVAWTMEGSTGSVRLTTKSTGAVPETKLPQAGVVLVTAKPTNSPSVKASCCEAPLVITRPSTQEVTCLSAMVEP